MDIAYTILTISGFFGLNAAAYYLRPNCPTEAPPDRPLRRR